ncbi:hypothetical protein MACH17_35130 [Phaeobacter inhibens]|nr:hypothetical protein MACH17_35130 [Phaeobacter inhibens]
MDLARKSRRFRDDLYVEFSSFAQPIYNHERALTVSFDNYYGKGIGHAAQHDVGGRRL